MRLEAGPHARRAEPAVTLGEGAHVEASVVAKLFGLRILRLHATVVIAPTDTRHTPDPTPALPASTDHAPGVGLAEATQRLRASADALGTRRGA